MHLKFEFCSFEHKKIACIKVYKCCNITLKAGGEADDFRKTDPSTQITTLTADKSDKIRKLQPDVITPSELVE